MYLVGDEQTPGSLAARRSNSRVETPEDVCVYWSYGGRDDTSRVRNLSLGGLFIETRKPIAVGAQTQLGFLVQEGQIKADAVLQYVSPGRGMSLKFTAVRDEGRPHLAALLNRPCRSSLFCNCEEKTLGYYQDWYPYHDWMNGGGTIWKRNSR